MLAIFRSIPLILFCFAPLIHGQEQNIPAKPAELSMTAVGRHHHPIATKSPEAQDYFDQGMTLLYGFNHEEAARSFQRSAELDPASPMPLWGIAMAVGPNYNADVDADREKLAFETMQKAKKLAEQAPQIERDYVDALAARYSSQPEGRLPTTRSRLRCRYEIPRLQISRRPRRRNPLRGKPYGPESLEALEQ